MVHAGFSLRRGLGAAACLALAASLSGAGLTTADYWNERLSPRGAGMADALAALGDGLDAHLNNPAALAKMLGPSLSFFHMSGLGGVNTEQFAYAQPFSFGSLGFGFAYRGQPDINNPLAADQPVSIYDLGLTASFAVNPARYLKDLPEFWRRSEIGISAKYLRSHLGPADADAYAVDLGGRWGTEEGLIFSVSALNVGPAVRYVTAYDPLPITFVGAVGKRFELFKGNWLSAELDVDYPLYSNPRARMGLEDQIGPNLLLRVGYLAQGPRDLNGISAGFTIRLDDEDLRFSLDYAWRPLQYEGFSSFDNQHLFGLSLGF